MSIPELRAVVVGTFEVTGNRVACCDPCYTDPYDLGCVVRARPGRWVVTAYVGDGGDSWGDRVWRLHARHEDATDTGSFEFVAECPVDGGVFGVFDARRYGEGDRNAELRAIMFPGGPAAKDAPDFAQVSNGVVVGSGYGDGGYNVYATVDAEQQAVAVVVVFIDAQAHAEHNAKEG